jgi:hypothetical protein
VLHDLDSAHSLVFMRVMEQLAQLFGARVGFFKAHEAEKAISWLLLQAERTV